jgi:lipopolysaccharide assembly outer membrane protein LptD (OstA)
VVLNSQFSSINFLRNESYQGVRTELYEKIKVPFHFRNYFDAELIGDVRASKYRLSEVERLDLDTLEVTETFNKNTDRVVPGISFKIDTALEKVYPVGQGSLIRRIADLGVASRTQEVTRVKHTIEPFTRYRYVPQVDQIENPQFDSYDRLADRNVVTYGVTQRLYSRHEPRNEYVYGIEEVTPEAQDMPSLRSSTPLDDRFMFGVEGMGGGAYAPVRRGSVRELANLTIKQSLNLDALRNNTALAEGEDKQRELSDVSADFTIRPNEYIGFHGSTNYDIEEQQVNSYILEGQFSDKRGDELRARFRYLDDSVSQLETSLQIYLHRRVKLGYYSRYDELDGEFLEQRAGLRFESDCKCWLLDLDVTDRLNPDETTFSFTVTLLGLGSFGNSFFELDQEDDETS